VAVLVYFSYLQSKKVDSFRTLALWTWFVLVISGQF